MEAAKYTIEYTISLGRHTPTHRYDTDSPVACTEFLVELLEHGFNVTAILREGMPLEPKQADHFIKQAASMLAARRICKSRRIDAAEEHHRFGFSA